MLRRQAKKVDHVVDTIKNGGRGDDCRQNTRMKSTRHVTGRRRHRTKSKVSELYTVCASGLRA